MKRSLMALALASLLPLAAAGGGGDPLSGLRQETFRFVCTGGQTLRASYVRSGGAGEAVVLFLEYRGRVYGLAQAVSASGARFVGLTSPDLPNGLEFWSKGDAATLSTFPADQPARTRPLLECRVAG